MKLVKGKYIRLTEQELSSLIKEAVQKELKLIMEYAIPRDKFVDNVFNLSSQIIENWCLVHYCTLTDTDINKCKEHWKRELRGHMNNVWNKVIKNHKDFDTRYNAIAQGFDYNDLFESVERIVVLTQNKFKDEQINTNSAEYLQTCTDCFKSIKTMMEIMANIKTNDINDYIENI